MAGVVPAESAPASGVPPGFRKSRRFKSSILPSYLVVQRILCQRRVDAVPRSGARRVELAKLVHETGTVPIRLTLLFTLLAVCLNPSAAAAQEPAPQTATDIVGFLMLNQAVPTADFERDRAAADAARQTIVNALLVNLGSVPLSTSSSGFVYRFNEQLGTVERASDTFGAFFVERALTPGIGHPSVGVSFATSAFDKLDGQNLRDGTLVTIANRFRDEPAPFDTESLTLKIRSSTMTVFGSVPLTNSLEIGAAVPFLQLSLDGSRINVYRGSTFAQATASADASGIGDVAVRGKYLIFSDMGLGVAAAAELRLPTGDRDNLLGAGSASVRAMAIGSYEPSGFALHANLGFTRGGVSDEVSFGAAVLAAVGPRLTVSGELLGRRISELRSIDFVAAPHPTIAGVDTFRLVAGEGGNTTVQVVGGLKWNLTGRAVLGAHVRWTATENGLTAPLTPSVAFEYAF